MTLRLRENARYGDPVRLDAQFYSGGELHDPYSLERVEIYKGGDGVSEGGTLVDVVDSSGIIRTTTGLYYIILDLLGDTSPASPTAPTIEANVEYWDKWVYKETATGTEISTVGLNFYLYPQTSFVCDDSNKFRFEMKADRKRIIKGEILDIRLQIIPIPLYRSRREPIVDYLLPISTMRAKIVDANNVQQVDWQTLRFTGKEGILPTNLFANLQLGEYHIVAELNLPNGQTVRYPRTPVMLSD